MKIRLGGHWLAFLWAITTPEPLVEAVKKAKSAGASVFELIYHVLNGLSAEQTAAALKEGGMGSAIMCVFFPPGDNGECPMGDPLSQDREQVDKAIATFKQVVQFIQELRNHGIEIDLIVGPSCWVLGKDYQVDWPTRKERIKSFYKSVDADLRGAGIDIAIEMLRREEDLVLETVEDWNDLCEELYSELAAGYGAHYDTFHIDQRGFDQVASITTLADSIFHLHVNGTDRRPAGGDGDKMDWAGIHTALENNCHSFGIATNEPFCDLVRQSCPPLGVGLPPAAEEPGGIVKTRETLEASGFEIET